MKLHLEEEINASADKVWTILAHQFAEIGDWASTVHTSRVIDMSEVPNDFNVAATAPVPGRATTNELGELREILTEYSEANKELTFRVAGLPRIMKSAVDIQKVIPKGPDKCLMTFDIEMIARGPFRLLGPVLKQRLTGGLGDLLKELKLYAETGQLSEKKRKQLEK